MVDTNGDTEQQKKRLEDLKERTFSSGAKRDSNKYKPYVHNLKGYTRLRFGYHMNAGAQNYGDSNWEKGMPSESYLESMDRHMAKYLYNLQNNLPQEEDHLSAIIFGAQGCMMNEQQMGIKPDYYYNLKYGKEVKENK